MKLTASDNEACFDSNRNRLHKIRIYFFFYTIVGITRTNDFPSKHPQ